MKEEVPFVALASHHAYTWNLIQTDTIFYKYYCQTTLLFKLKSQYPKLFYFFFCFDFIEALIKPVKSGCG